MRVSKSRNVCGYVKAVRKAQAAAARLAAAEEKAEETLRPLRTKLEVANADMRARYAQLTGGQIAEARRITTARMSASDTTDVFARVAS